MAALVASYPYHDAKARLLFEVQRFDPKAFKIVDELGTELSAIPDRTVLYRLPALLAAEPSETVYIVEGEKDADLLDSLGLRATTNPGGTRLGWLSHYATWLKDRHVVIFQDVDRPGKKHALRVADALRSIAASVVIVELPQLRGNQDVSDWMVNRTVDQLLAQVAKARFASAGLNRFPIKRDQERLIFGASLAPAAKLLLLALRHQIMHGHEPVIVRVKDLANMMGQHRVSAQKLLGKLRRQGVVRRAPTGHVIDWEILAAMQPCKLIGQVERDSTRSSPQASNQHGRTRQ